VATWSAWLALNLAEDRLFPCRADAYSLEEVEPVYETLPGWQAELSDCRRLSDLPRQARSYIRRISRHLGVPVGIVSVGPAREQTIFCEVES